MEKFVCFDLDGTLIDTLTGITKAVNITLKEIGLPYQYDKKTVETFIGRGAKRLFNLAFKNNEKPADFDLFLKNYEKYQYVSEPFLGVVETLKELENRGYKLIIFSNKPDDILQKLIKEKLGEINFIKVQGQDKNYPPKPDVTLLKKILVENGLNEIDGFYVGDSVVDILTARNINMKCAIMSFGYGNKEEIDQEKPDYYLDNFSDLLEIL